MIAANVNCKSWPRLVNKCIFCFRKCHWSGHLWINPDGEVLHFNLCLNFPYKTSSLCRLGMPTQLNWVLRVALCVPTQFCSSYFFIFYPKNTVTLVYVQRKFAPVYRAPIFIIQKKRHIYEEKHIGNGILLRWMRNIKKICLIHRCLKVIVQLV